MGTAPKQDVPSKISGEGHTKTYSEWLDKLKCTCPAGAQIRPSSLPTATANLGDVIADHTRILSTFASAYGVVVVVLKMVTCIIDVLCCLVNPLCLVFSIIRLFGTCLPDFILIFPQLATPAIIICIVKIVLAMVEYILTVLLPIIQEIITNIQDLIDAFSEDNKDAIAAVSFKLAALIKELYNVLGILAVLSAIWVMIKALLSAGIGLPCADSGGSCSGCGDSDDICPTTLQQTSLTGTDGQFIILFWEDGFSFQILFYSASRKSNFLQIQNFFPRGLDYTEIKDEDNVPYILNITQTDGSVLKYMVTSVDSGGYSTLYQLPPDYILDGYLSNTTPAGLPLSDPLDARFNTKTETFTFSLGSTDRYITMQDTRGAYQSYINGGSWKIQSKYDAYNILLTRTDGTWDYGAPNEHIRWKLEPSAPTITSGLRFELDINHEELIRHGLIGVGCHPAVQATKTALSNRFPDLANLTLPALPDFDGLLLNIDSCISKVAPINVDAQYVLDNYQTIATGVVGLNDCVTSTLNNFKTEAEDYAKLIYPIIFDPEVSADGYFSALPAIQIIGQHSDIELTPFDRNGGFLGVTVSPGIVEVEFDTNFGTLSSVETELDGYDPTGKYLSTITSLIPGVATITAQVGGRDVAYFDGYNLVAKEVQVEFVTAEEARRRIIGKDSTEPLSHRGA